MPPVSKQQAAIELLRRRRARDNLVDYARYIDIPGVPLSDDEDCEDFSLVEKPFVKHHQLILETTQRCMSRYAGRSMLFLPPGSAKSTYATVVAPTFAMGLNPGSRVIGISYGLTLSTKFGRRMRSIVKSKKFKNVFNCELSKDSTAALSWALTNGSEYMGGGIETGVTGNRADFIAIDDPVKGRREALSEKIKASTMASYQDNILSRLKPSGSLMLTMTRWTEDDLAGSILPENYNGESGLIECRDGKVWEVVCIPAKCEREDDPLGRKPGEYLWPEWFPRSHWEQFELNTNTWSSLYQQRPSPETGNYFRLDWLREYDTLPPLTTLKVYMASDYAVTNNGGDYTVHIVVGIDPEGRLWLIDLWRKQASSDVWVQSWCDLVKKYKPSQAAEETGQIRSGVGPFLTKRAREVGAYVWRRSFPTRGDKSVRAQSIRGRMAMVGLMVPRHADWLPAFKNELSTFPNGKNDDQVDALGLIGQLLDIASDGKKEEIKVLNKNKLDFISDKDGFVKSNLSFDEAVSSITRRKKINKDR